MWANTQPDGGIILVGISDSGEITGCRRQGTNHNNDIQDLTRHCEDARWTVKEIPLTNKYGEADFLLAYRVQYREDRVVETSSRKAFLREGSTKIEMNEALKREHRIAKGEVQYELDRINCKYPDDFDNAEISQFCMNFTKNRGLTQNNSHADILTLAKLGKQINGVFYPNLACFLLFARDPRSEVPGAFIRILRYEGNEEKFGSSLNVIYDTEVEGPILKMIDAAKEKISSQIRFRQRLVAGHLEKTPEYPEAAWLEAVVNAVAHRSYNFKSQNIFIKMFDDRIVVESPGGFVPPTTAQSIYTAHNPRNPWLMQAMRHMRLAFCGFEGTRRMRQEMTLAHLPEPKFVQIEATSYQVHVTLRNRLEAAVAESVPSNIPTAQLSKLTAPERQIVEFLFQNPFVTIKTVAAITGRAWPTARKHVQHLIELGILEMTQEGTRGSAPKKSYKLRRPSSINPD